MKRRTNAIIEIIIRRWWIVVGIGVLATFALVLYMGMGQNIWFDESYSINLAKQSIPDLLRLTGVDAHPPLFYLLLKVWGSLFGWSELALRSMSALLAALTVGAMAVLLRRLFTARLALVVLPLLVIAPFALRYGYEIRMYALAALIGVLASLTLVHAVQAKTDKRWWGLYIVFVAAGMYTLYMTAVIWLAHVVWLSIRHHRPFWKQPWVRSYIIIGLLFLPYIPTLLFQFTHSALPGIGHRLNLTAIGDVIGQVLVYTPEWSIGGWTALGILALIGLSTYLFIRAFQHATMTSRRSLQLILCLGLVPFVFFVIISLPPIPPIFVSRYLAHVIIFVYAMIGVAAALGWRYGYRKPAVVLYILATTLSLWGDGQLVLAGNFNYDRFQHPQTTKVRKLVDCKKSVIVADDAYTYINNMYYFDGCDMRFYSPYDLPFQGGYAWLSGSSSRLATSKDLNAPSMVHLYWGDNPPSFQPDSRYRLVSSVKYDQQVTDTYTLSEE